MGLFAKKSVWPCAKDHSVLRMRKNHVSVQRCRISFTTIVLGDHDFPLTGLNSGKLTTFRAILGRFSLTMRRNGYL